MKFDLDDKIYQLESANNTINMLKNSINEVQMNQDTDRNDFENKLREGSMRQRRTNDEIEILKEQVERLQRTSQKHIQKSYTISYSEEEMQEIQNKLNKKQTELANVKNEDIQKTYFIENFQVKIEMQERLIQQL